LNWTEIENREDRLFGKGYVDKDGMQKQMKSRRSETATASLKGASRTVSRSQSDSDLTVDSTRSIVAIALDR